MADEEGGGLKGRLTEKAGPLPVWGWAAVLVVGIAVMLHFRKKNSSDSASSNDSGTTIESATPDGLAGMIGADYDLRNALELNTVGEAKLATGLADTNKDLAATDKDLETNTAAEKADTAAENKESHPTGHKPVKKPVGGQHPHKPAPGHHPVHKRPPVKVIHHKATTTKAR